MDLKRVALVFPETVYAAGQPPLGVGYLAASILRDCSGVEPVILDRSFERNPRQALLRDVGEGCYDLLGISLVTPHLGMMKELALAAKQARPETLVVVGGPHATMLPEATLAIPGVDIVCEGEGEQVLVELLRAGGNPRGIAGLLYRDESGQVVRQPRHQEYANLDEIPIPARQLYDMENYLTHWYSMDTVRQGMRGTSVLATRGCPYRCTFCQPTISTMFGNKIRKRDPVKIVDEIEQMRDQFRLEAFMFEDSTFILDHAWVRRICRELMERKIGLLWCCNVRVDLASFEILRDMKEAGLRKVNMGVESGSNRILRDIYDKGTTTEMVRKCLADCKRLGLKVQGYFMMGAPTETRREMQETIRLAADEPFDDAVFDIATPFPGTLLYDMSSQNIVLPFEEFDCFQKTVYNHAGELSPQEVAELKRRAYWLFYLHPRRFLHTISSVLAPKGLGRLLLKARRV
jgi:anaerobic magnesium-protoporphyrin IX monomethyl ester cyclase